MTEQAILEAVARADLILSAALRIGRLALCAGAGVWIGRMLMRRS